MSKNNLIHVFRNGFFPLSTSNKLLQITPHFCSYCSDKSLKQHSKTLESVDSRSLTFRIAIRTEKSPKATTTLSPRGKPRKICEGNLQLMETPLEIFTLSLYSIFHIVLSYIQINTNLSGSLNLLQCLSPPATPCPWISDPPALAAAPHTPVLGTVRGVTV